jgi:hypothetical protein
VGRVKLRERTKEWVQQLMKGCVHDVSLELGSRSGEHPDAGSRRASGRNFQECGLANPGQTLRPAPPPAGGPLPGCLRIPAPRGRVIEMIELPHEALRVMVGLAQKSRLSAAESRRHGDVEEAGDVAHCLV